MNDGYCIHGQYVGTPSGPDYICGYCEAGVTHAAYMRLLNERRTSRIRAASMAVHQMTGVIATPGVTADDQRRMMIQLSSYLNG